MLNLLNHPIIESELTKLRDKRTSSELFRQSVVSIGSCMAYEVLKNLPTREIQVETPLETTKGIEITSKVVFIPILRAGLGLLPPFMKMYPKAEVGYIGIRRNETTFHGEEYYFNVPEINSETRIFLLEIMLATGGSLISAISRLKLEGAAHINVVALISAPEGIERIATEYPEIAIYTAAIDRGLNEKKYIVPGLGDAGDRLNGT
ncbi:MAG: uracil phosphoribosyltransferase [Candidatus Kapabacteria bacterium]|nr:uracil phosphoribosyltransferase [Candidatus Kapabacteria bacterium]